MAYLVPLVFGAGSAVAALEYVAAGNERLALRVEILRTRLAEQQQLNHELRADASTLQRDVASIERGVGAIVGRLTMAERNIAVLCSQRGTKCEH